MAGTFGTSFADLMTLACYRDGSWSEVEVRPVEPLGLHPAAHVLHYASECFEGLKAYRWADGSIKIFRLDQHIDRMRNSAIQLCLPAPETELLEAAIHQAVDAARDVIPPFPSALYIRPTLIGSMPNIGAAGKAADEAMLYVLVSPVGEYFDASRTLRILISEQMRTTPSFGRVKTGGNYAAALAHVTRARERYNADQVLFCPNGDVQETGAANFLLLRDGEILTKQLDGSILPGVTRDSLLRLAEADGWESNERSFQIAEMLEWIKTGEAAMSGTAAVLASVGALIHDDHEHLVNDAKPGPLTLKLRDQLTAIQSGAAEDRFGWLHSL